MAAELAAARSHVYLAGWHFSPDFALVRGSTPVVLRNLLAELAERIDVYVLVWAGAPLPLFRPSRAHGAADAWRSSVAGRRCGGRPTPGSARCTATTKRRSWSTTASPSSAASTSPSRAETGSTARRIVARAQIGWHDVSTRFEGPAVADVAGALPHALARGDRRAAADRSVSRDSRGAPTVQIVRTVPERVYAAVPRGDFRILESYLRALRSAQSLIYLENQFLWSPEVAAVLREKLRRPPSDDFRLLLLLPAKPNTGADDTRGMLAELIEADDGAGRLLACTIYARHGLAERPGLRPRQGRRSSTTAWLTIGSANLNEHSLFNDTEMNVVCRDADLVRETRLRLWAEHLELDAAEIDGAPSEVIDRYWKPISREQLASPKPREPLTHRLVELPNVSSRSERLLGPLQGLLVDG